LRRYATDDGGVSIKGIIWDKLMSNGKDIGNLIPVSNLRCDSVCKGKIFCPTKIHYQIIEVSGDNTVIVQKVR